MLSISKGHHPVESRRRSADGAEWSCVAGLKLRCVGRERWYDGRRTSCSFTTNENICISENFSAERQLELSGIHLLMMTLHW